MKPMENVKKTALLKPKNIKKRGTIAKDICLSIRQTNLHPKPLIAIDQRSTAIFDSIWSWQSLRLRAKIQRKMTKTPHSYHVRDSIQTKMWRVQIETFHKDCFSRNPTLKAALHVLLQKTRLKTAGILFSSGLKTPCKCTIVRSISNRFLVFFQNFVFFHIKMSQEIKKQSASKAKQLALDPTIFMRAWVHLLEAKRHILPPRGSCFWVQRPQKTKFLHHKTRLLASCKWPQIPPNFLLLLYYHKGSPDNYRWQATP